MLLSCQQRLQNHYYGYTKLFVKRCVCVDVVAEAGTRGNLDTELVLAKVQHAYCRKTTQSSLTLECHHSQDALVIMAAKTDS